MFGCSLELNSPRGQRVSIDIRASHFPNKSIRAVGNIRGRGLCFPAIRCDVDGIHNPTCALPAPVGFSSAALRVKTPRFHFVGDGVPTNALRAGTERAIFATDYKITDNEIAATLGLSFSTVRTYLDRVFERSGVSDRMHLVLRIFSIHAEQARCRKGL